MYVTTIISDIWGQFHQHFTRTDPKSPKNTIKPSAFLSLLGSALVKAVSKMLVKLISGRIISMGNARNQGNC